MNNQQGSREGGCTRDDNVFPDCVLLSLQPIGSSNATIPIHVDISFNSEWLEVPVRRFFKKKTWKVEFAIRAGDLVFELSNLTSPSDKRNFVKELLDGQVVKQEVTTSRSAFDETTKGAGVALQIKPSVATMSLNTQSGYPLRPTSPYILWLGASVPPNRRLYDTESVVAACCIKR